MKRLAALCAVVGTLAVIPAASAGSTPALLTCHGRPYSALMLKVHDLSCRNAYASILHESKHFRCNKPGDRYPAHIVCVSRSRSAQVYAYELRPS